MCRRPCADLFLAGHAWPPAPDLWLHRGVSSASLVVWSLHSGTSDDVVFLQKLEGMPTGWAKVSLGSCTCSGPAHGGCCNLRVMPSARPQQNTIFHICVQYERNNPMYLNILVLPKIYVTVQYLNQQDYRINIFA
jgi:hypothetical protein